MKRLPLLFLPALLILAGFSVVEAQQEKQLGTKAEIDARKSATSKSFKDFVEGATKPDKNDQEVLEAHARWYIYPVTWATLSEDARKQIVPQFQTMKLYVLDKKHQENNRIFLNQFSKQLVKAFKEVFDLEFERNRLSIANAAVMLPILGELKTDDVSDFLVGLVKDDMRHELIRYYAAKSLAPFFPVTLYDFTSDRNDTFIVNRKKRDVERVNALSEYIERAWPKPADSHEKDAIHFSRRAAIESLGRAQLPAVANIAKMPVEGPAVATLLRVLQGKLDPEPSLQEKLEAALGILRFSNLQKQYYNPLPGLHLIGDTLVELGKGYSTDFPKVKDKIQYVMIGWKDYAVQFRELEKLSKTIAVKDDAKASEVAKDVAKTLNDAAKTYILDPISKSQQANDYTEIRRVMDAKGRPKGMVPLYKEGKGPTIDMGGN